VENHLPLADSQWRMCGTNAAKSTATRSTGDKAPEAEVDKAAISMAQEPPQDRESKFERWPRVPPNAVQ
jgi:hypothetical protein